jgi:hypothetical protein
VHDLFGQVAKAKSLPTFIEIVHTLFIFKIFFFYLYVHTMFGSFLPPSPLPLLYPISSPPPSIPGLFILYRQGNRLRETEQDRSTGSKTENINFERRSVLLIWVLNFFSLQGLRIPPAAMAIIIFWRGRIAPVTFFIQKN